MSAIKGLPRGITAGEMRQAKRQGFTESGAYSIAYLSRRVESEPYMYLLKTEPGGKVMNHVEEVKVNLSEAAEAMIKAGTAVRDTAVQTIASITDNNRKLRDNNTRLTDSINVFLKTATKAEYIKAINDVERLATALEKIADLEKAGILNKLAAIVK